MRRLIFPFIFSYLSRRNNSALYRSHSAIHLGLHPLLWVNLLSCSIFLFWLAGCASRPEQSADTAGKALYITYCVTCHGEDGRNDRQGASGAMRLMAANGLSDNDWYTLVKKGRGEMPAFHDRLSPKELSSLRTYIQSLGKTSTFSQ